MVFLRSEDHVRRWLTTNGWEPGATLAAPIANELAVSWWRTRLDVGWRPRTTEESQALLEAAGLVGEFWALHP